MRNKAFLAAALALWTATASAVQLVPGAAVPAAERLQLEDAGYTVGDASILGRDGKPLTDEQLAALREAVDWRKEKLTDEERSDLVLSGCRFEPSAKILCLPDKHALTKLELAGKRNGSRESRHDTLERVAALLEKQDPTAPLSPEAAGYIKRVDQAIPGALPPSIVQAAAAPKAITGDVTSGVESAYLESTKFFDGRAGDDKREANAVALPADWTPKPPQEYFDDSEKKLGDALRSAAVEVLSRNPVGLEVVSAFPKGVPPMTILPVESGAAAFFHDGRIVLNAPEAANVILAGKAKPDQARLKRAFARPRGLADYLLAHPAELRRVVAASDSTIVHELTHAVQEQRDRFAAEAWRGNVLDADYVEQEHEAFLTELRYIHKKMLADPKATMTDGDLERYEGLITDLDRWRDGITQSYFESWPAGAANLQTARDVSAARKKAARELMDPLDFKSLWEQSLKLLGLKQGDRELEDYAVAHNARMEAFRAKEYPTMRKESSLVLARAWSAKARRETRSFDRKNALDTALEHAKAAGDAALIADLQKRLAKEKGR